MLSIERTSENLFAGGKTVTKPIDPNTKAELIELCINGILELFAAHDTYETEGQTDPYLMMGAIGDLLETNPELYRRLAEVNDPQVDYHFVTAAWGEDLPDDPTSLPEHFKKAIASDVAFCYAWTSPEIRALEEQRAA